MAATATTRSYWQLWISVPLVSFLLLVGMWGFLYLAALNAWPAMATLGVLPSLIVLCFYRAAPMLSRGPLAKLIPIPPSRRHFWIFLFVFLTFFAIVLGMPACTVQLCYGKQSGAAAMLAGFASWLATSWIFGLIDGRARLNRRLIEAVEEERLRTWRCPRCHKVYGVEASLIRHFEFGNNPMPGCELGYVSLWCRHCNYFSCFNAFGNVLFGGECNLDAPTENAH